MLRNALLAGLLTVAPGFSACLEIPKWRDPPADAGSVLDADHVQDVYDTPQADVQGGLDTVILRDVPENDCYENRFDTPESLTSLIAQNGNWQISPFGFLQETSAVGGPRVAYFPSEYVNFEATVKVRIPENGTDVHAALIFRYNPLQESRYDYRTDHGYAFQLETSNRDLGEGTHVTIEDFYQSRLSSRAVPFSIGEWQELKVIIRNEEIIGFLNKEQILRLTDLKYSRGKIGLASHAGSVHFDDLEICPVR